MEDRGIGLRERGKSRSGEGESQEGRNRSREKGDDNGYWDLEGQKVEEAGERSWMEEQEEEDKGKEGNRGN